MATDAEIRAAGLYAVPKNKYLQNEFQLPTEEVVEETESFGIPQTKAFTNSGGNDFSGSTSNLGGDFQRAVDARQNRLNAPIDNSTFLGKAMGTVKNFMNPQSADEIMAEGYQEPRFQPGIIGTIMGKLDNYRNLPQADQAFIAQNMGYTGPTIFGENNSGLSKDEFGINTRSLFGNYAAYVDKMNEKKNDKGVAVKDMTDDEFDDYTAGLKGMKKKSAILYKRKLKERQTIIDNKKAADLKAFEDQKTRSGITSGANDGRYENIDDRDRGGQGAFKEDKTSMKSAGKSYQDAQGSVGYSRGRKDGGRIGYFFGGRVNYKAGGRINFKGGGMDMGNEENQKQSANIGGGKTGDLSSAEQTMNHNRVMRGNQKPPEPLVKNIIDIGSELNYLNNVKNLNLPALAVSFGVNKFRNYLENRKTKEEDDKLSYNTNSLPTNNYLAEVQKKDLDASKMKGFKQQDYPSYKDQMDMLNGGTKVTPYEFQGLQDGTITTTGTFTAANGGRAMFKNGGLAGLL